MAAQRTARTAARSVPLDYLGRLLRAFEQDAASTWSHAGPRTRIVQGPVEALSGRELEVLRLLAAGRQNRQIAEALVVAPSTVKKHVTHILDKLGAANRTETTARARELGLLLPRYHLGDRSALWVPESEAEQAVLDAKRRGYEAINVYDQLTPARTSGWSRPRASISYPSSVTFRSCSGCRAPSMRTRIPFDQHDPPPGPLECSAAQQLGRWGQRSWPERVFGHGW